MKHSFGIAIMAALLAVPAFAASHSQSITLANPVTVGTTKLPAGEYKISWTGTAPDVQVTLEQKGANHPVTATVPAKLTTEKHDRAQFTTGQQDGARTLESVQLKDATLNFTATPVSGQ